jgi:Ca2+-transporting ATPase
MAACRDASDAGGTTALTEARVAALVAANDAMASRALRVLAIAEGEVSTAAERAIGDLTFLGFIGFIDPPAPGVASTIATLKAAGLKTIMLTGDQRVTAETIGGQLGVVEAGQRVVDGAAVDGMSDADLGRCLADAGAFSRVSPQHKLRIVEALQARGDIVAMLGDGVNDAPALKHRPAPAGTEPPGPSATASSPVALPGRRIGS